MIPAPMFGRLEYLGREGWSTGHAGISLMDPQKYVDKLTQRDVYARVLELDDTLQPNGVVYEPKFLPAQEDLCSVCRKTDHDDGMCLI